MNLDREALAKSLENKLADYYGKENITTIGKLAHKISKLSKVHVRTCDITEYDEISLQDMDSTCIVKIVQDSDKKPVNASALERQRLHKGDIVFSYRGKLGKIGLVEEEHPIPLIGNHGMMRIAFDDDRKEDTPRYVQTYLQTPLIKSFVDMMLEDNQITVSLLESLPIPMFNEMEGMSSFSTLINKRRDITQKVENLLQQCMRREKEVLLLTNRPLQELSHLNAIDNTLLDELESLVRKADISIPKQDNFLQEPFEVSGEEE